MIPWWSDCLWRRYQGVFNAQNSVGILVKEVVTVEECVHQK